MRGAGGLFALWMKPLRPQASQDRNPNRVPLSPLTLGPLVQKGSPLRTQREAGDSQGFQLFWGAYGKQVGAGSMTDTSRPFVAGWGDPGTGGEGPHRACLWSPCQAWCPLPAGLCSHCFHGAVLFLMRVACWQDLKQFVILLKLHFSLG